MMENNKSTKRALLTSALALLMCVAMLIGATFAWFTDTASTGVNKIQAGNLDVELEYKNSDTPNFTKADKNTKVFKEGALWEPGHVEYVVLKVSNAGSLALKYKLGINIASETGSTNVLGNEFKLSNYIRFAVLDGDQSNLGRDNLVATAGNGAALNAGYTAENHLTATGTDNSQKVVTLVVWMPTTVGNGANYKKGAAAPSIDLGISVVATQYTHENDSFDNQYDKDAPLDFEPVSTAAELKVAATNGKNVQLTQDVTLTDTLAFNSPVTIDLNGKTLSSSLNNENKYSLVTFADATIVNGTYKGTGMARGIAACGNLKMRNVTVDVVGQIGVACGAGRVANGQYTIEDSTIKGGYALCNFNDNVTINVSNSTLEGKNTGFYHNGSFSGLNLTVTGTKINAGNNGADATGVYISGSTATRDAGGYQKASFTDCTVKGNAAIEVKYTDLTLNNCTVTATVPAANASYTQNNNGSTTNGFAVVSTDNATNNTMPKPEGTITINGGSYTGLIGLHSFTKIAEAFPGFVDTTYVINN